MAVAVVVVVLVVVAPLVEVVVVVTIHVNGRSKWEKHWAFLLSINGEERKSYSYLVVSRA